nr:unnamed protein product [Digitaria exilis]
MAGKGYSLPDDLLVLILLLLPTSSRRRFRLVCKRWRDMVNERTPELQVRAEILAFISQHGGSRALLFDNESGGRRRWSWKYPCSHQRSNVALVGTCNGLLCLHESLTTTAAGDGSSFSTITVTNSITGETQALPPAPRSPEWEQMRAPGKYTFGYHPTTGRYKVVHVPCGRRQVVDALQVFTLGVGTSWRAVPVDTTPGGGATYNRLCDAISRVTSFAAPPLAGGGGGGLIPAEAGWDLTNVHARLGAVVATSTASVEVWVLDDGGGAQPRRWSRRNNIVGATTSRRWIAATTVFGSWIVAPQLTHGDCILRASRDRIQGRGSWSWGMRRLYQHKVDDLTGGGGGRRLSAAKGRELLMNEDERNGVLTTFAYVETLEPLPRIQG